MGKLNPSQVKTSHQQEQNQKVRMDLNSARIGSREVGLNDGMDSKLRHTFRYRSLFRIAISNQCKERFTVADGTSSDYRPSSTDKAHRFTPLLKHQDLLGHDILTLYCSLALDYTHLRKVIHVYEKRNSGPLSVPLASVHLYQH